MRHTNYFLISPNASLIARLHAEKTPELLDLAQPVVWSGDEADKSNLSPNDYEFIVKILFLDVLKREHKEEIEFETVFFDFSISDSYFNLFWTLRRIPLDMSVEIALQDSLATGTLDLLKKVGNERVQTWLSINAWWRDGRDR